MDPILMHRRTLLGKALGVGMLLLAKAAMPAAAKDIPPYKDGEPDVNRICRNIRKSYQDLEDAARGVTDKAILEQVEADKEKLEGLWRSQGCQSNFDNIAVARIPPLPGQMGPNPIAPPSVGVVAGGGSSSKKPKKPKKPSQVAPPPTGAVRIAGHSSGKRRP